MRKSSGPLVLQDKEYPPGVLPPEGVIREILWELYELNFIRELVSLDRRAKLDLSDTVQLLDRQTKITSGDAQFPVTARLRHITSHHEICHICDI